MNNLLEIIYISAITVCLLLVSCSDMNELSDRFLKEGETTYATLPDSVTVGAGKERVQFEIFITTNRVKTTRIYWNNHTDSVDIEIGNQAGVFYKTIENLPEQSYLFDLVNLDQYGNRSLPYEVSGRSLGEKYESTMLNRRLVSLSANNAGNKVLVWGGMDESLDAGYTEISYTNTEDENVLIEVPLSDNSTIITDLKPGSLPKYRTVYIPDEMVVDVFYTDFAEASLAYDGDFLLIKSEISIMGYSNQHDSGDNAAKHALDDNYTNRWHTRVGKNYPHWMVFDIGGEVLVSRFSIWPSVFGLETGKIFDNRLPATFSLWGRNDEPPSDNLSGEEGWTQLGNYSIEERGGEQTFIIDNPIPVKYLKMSSPNGLNGTTMMVIGEFDIYSR